jgi:GrpB-like predicted nucleotidyltransferase (UPF0157 family)
VDGVPSAEEIVTFLDDTPPPGESPYVPGFASEAGVAVVPYAVSWPETFAEVERQVREALGFRVLSLEHVGSTSVPGLAAKPVIDVDLVVADPDDEAAYVPPLERAGFVLRIREPWWYRHRLLRHDDPRANLHVFGPESPEPVRHRLFRDWLRSHPGDRELYASVKREAAHAANAGGESVEQYNARKQQVLREIYARAFEAAGLLRG